MSVANFLRQFQQEEQPGNSLLDNVNLLFYSSLSPRDDNRIMPILVQLMPMIGNINFISICRSYHMEFGHTGLEPNNAASQLLMTMLTKARILKIRVNMEMSMFSWWCHWLYTPRNDGKPRALRLIGLFPDTENFVEQIKKDFLKAIRPVSFFVYVRAVGRGNVDWQGQGICLDNDHGRTNERLVVKTIDPPSSDPYLDKFVLISRYPLGTNQGWIEANEQEIVEWDFREQNRWISFERS